MTPNTWARILTQIKLALLGDCCCSDTLSAMTREAKGHGMTGAEIDTAISGRSFEARSHAAIAYACAIKSGSPDAIAISRSRASKMGLSDKEIDAVEVAARQIIAMDDQ